MNPEAGRLRREDAGAELIRRSAAGDAEAFAGLYDLHCGLLFSVACRMLRDAQEAEDAVQDAFLRAWEEAGEYDAARGSSRAWLVVLLRSRCLDRLRRREARGRYESAATRGAPETGGRPDADGGDETRLRAMVRQAMAELPAAQRQAVEAAFFGELSHREAAERLGEPLGTVKTRLRLAARKLAERLGPVWDL